MTKSHNQFQRGAGVYACRCCKRATRGSGGDSAGVRLCDQCFELSGEENCLSDTGAFYNTPANVLATIAEVAARGGNAEVWDHLRDEAHKALKS